MIRQMMIRFEKSSLFEQILCQEFGLLQVAAEADVNCGWPDQYQASTAGGKRMVGQKLISTAGDVFYSQCSQPLSDSYNTLFSIT